MKNKYCIANWKMNKTSDESIQFLRSLINKEINREHIQIIICPAYPSLFASDKIIFNHHIDLGGQNMSGFDKGAHTGEVSADMLVDSNCKWVIIGHSERRSLYFESDQDINKKIKLCVKNKLSPILCIGESLDERKSNQTTSILTNQLISALKDVSISDECELLIAYEPVWAIGTGVNAEPEMIMETISIIKNALNDIGNQFKNISILYGGSVSTKNINQLSKINSVDGYLIGGASLDINEFYSIYENM